MQARQRCAALKIASGRIFRQRKASRCLQVGLNHASGNGGCLLRIRLLPFRQPVLKDCKVLDGCAHRVSGSQLEIGHPCGLQWFLAVRPAQGLFGFLDFGRPQQELSQPQVSLRTVLCLYSVSISAFRSFGIALLFFQPSQRQPRHRIALIGCG